MAISYFGAVGHGRQDVGDVLQGDGPSADTVCIGDMVHEPMYRPGNGGLP